MKLLNKLERRFGRYAIPNLMKYVVILYAIGVLFSFGYNSRLIPFSLTSLTNLDFLAVSHGQIWRLVTFVIPNGTEEILNVNFVFLLIMIYFYYIIGNALENSWGAFRLNLYFFSGILFNMLASFITFLITGISISPSLAFICGTLFFAYAALYPNTTFYLYFLIPVKAKYLAWFRAAMYLYSIYQYYRYGLLILVIPLIVSFANFFIFFFATRNYHRISPGEMRRKANYRRQMNDARNQGNVTQFKGHNVVTRHKCAVCGRTELDGDQLEFRFCSKCDGNYEYCMDHLFTHEHVKK